MNHLLYKTMNDLEIFKSFELESIFTEICNLKGVTIITGFIYKHRKMNSNKFNSSLMSFLINYWKKKNKTNTWYKHIWYIFVIHILDDSHMHGTVCYVSPSSSTILFVFVYSTSFKFMLLHYLNITPILLCSQTKVQSINFIYHSPS